MVLEQSPPDSYRDGTTITVERLKKRGYISLLEIYNQLKPEKGLLHATWQTP